MTSTRVRPVIPLVGAVIVLGALGLRLADHASAQAASHARERMTVVATRIDDPTGLVTRGRRDCPGQEDLVRCLQGPQAPDDLAAVYQAALSRAAGRTATVQCTTLPFGARPRDCLVRIDEGAHAVLVSITSRPLKTTGSMIMSGSTVRIDAN